jgi:hypothetical protein
MHCLLLTLALSAAFCSSAPAQTATTPDLSGTWKLNLAKGKPRIDKSVRPSFNSQTVIITSTNTTIQFQFVNNEHEYTKAYIPDGKERVAAEDAKVENLTIVAWKKSVLVIEEIGRWKAPGYTPEERETFHFTDRWTLSGDGRTLTLDSTGVDKHHVLVYDKQ